MTPKSTIEHLIALKDETRDRETRDAISAACNALSELEYAYRSIDFGFTCGTFDFSVLRKRAAEFVAQAL